VQNVQTLAIHATDYDVYVSYSEGGLQQEATRFLLKASTGAGSGEEGVVFTFPLKAYSGLLWFASKNAASSTSVMVWTFSCGSSEY